MELLNLKELVAEQYHLKVKGVSICRRCGSSNYHHMPTCVVPHAEAELVAIQQFFNVTQTQTHI